jgi:hypothetical protein
MKIGIMSFACQDVVLSLRLSGLSDGRHGWCCLTAHQLACLEKLVLRYALFSVYRKNECQCVLSFQYPMSLLGLDGTLSPERERSSSSLICSSATSAIRTKQIITMLRIAMNIGNENDQVK